MYSVFLPANAKSLADLSKSSEILNDFLERDIPAGLMLLIKNGKTGLQNEEQKIQYKNLSDLSKKFGPIPVIVMAANLPLSDLDFYHFPERSIEHIKLACDFAADLPGKNEYPIVSFHLNTLMSNDEWISAGDSPEEKLDTWKKKFSKIVWPSLAIVAEYAKRKKIELKIETTPVPEWGDIGNPQLNTLGNPYPLFAGRGFTEIRNTGLGIVLDLCHTFTLYKAAEQFKSGDNNETKFDTYKGLFPEDLSSLTHKPLMQEIDALEPGDVVHLNDSKNLYDPKKMIYHQEGVTLGDGEINGLPEIIKKIADKELRIVFEINEEDYVKRPNLIRSINYFLKILNND